MVMARVRLYQDEWEGLQIEVDAAESELENYGVDVPGRLIAIAKRLNEEWNTYQVELKAWWESSLPEDEAAAERVAGVAFYGERTWAQLKRFDGCLHIDATKSLRGDPSRGIALCDICGEHVYASQIKGEW